MFRLLCAAVVLCAVVAVSNADDSARKEKDSDGITLQIKRCALPDLEAQAAKEELIDVVAQIKAEKNPAKVRELKSHAKALNIIYHQGKVDNQNKTVVVDSL